MDELVRAFGKMLEEHCPTTVVRAIEAGDSPAPLWQTFEESGFLDALVPEEAGGAGLALADVVALLLLVGRYAVPLPLGETMLARGLLARSGMEWPAGPMAVAGFAGGLPVPGEEVATHLLVARKGGVYLVANASGSETVVALAPDALRAGAGIVRAAAIAGAGERVLEMSIAYANERVQFGKPIGRQQAIQQQLARMAEDVVACRMAVGLAGKGGFPPDLSQVAVAKSVTSAAAPRMAATAHAVHGAIGISREHDLQLFTRRLRLWRLVDGSESWWNRWLGRQRLEETEGTVEWVRKALFVE